MRTGRGNRGYTIIEIMVVLVIVSIVAVMTMVRFSYFDVRHGCKAVAQVLVGDIKLQQQRTITLERSYGITIAPGGNYDVYELWVNDGGFKILKRFSLSGNFPGRVHFGAGQADRQIAFFPWTSGTGGETDDADPIAPAINEWALAKVIAPVPTIVVQAGNMQQTITIDVQSALITVTEQQI